MTGAQALAALVIFLFFYETAANNAALGIAEIVASHDLGRLTVISANMTIRLFKLSNLAGRAGVLVVANSAGHLVLNANLTRKLDP
jgi:hypothetical protein